MTMTDARWALGGSTFGLVRRAGRLGQQRRLHTGEASSARGKSAPRRFPLSAAELLCPKPGSCASTGAGARARSDANARNGRGSGKLALERQPREAQDQIATRNPKGCGYVEVADNVWVHVDCDQVFAGDQSDLRTSRRRS